MNEDKSSRYHRLGRRASVMAAGVPALVLAGLLATGGSRSLASAARAVAPDPYTALALYVLALVLCLEAALLPVACYRGFLLERRYGLSTESLRSWLRDHGLSVALGALLAVGGAEIVYGLIRHAPVWWWLPAAAVFATAVAAIAGAAPVLLLPLFYRMRPLARPSLGERLVALSARAGVPILGVYEWGLGERTRRANAALVGSGRTRRILVSDTMLQAYSDDEIEVVLAHELAHHVHRDIRTGLLLESAVMTAALFAAAVALAAGWRLLRLESPSDVAGLPLLLLAAGAIRVAAAPLINALSRRNERRADRYALELTRQPAAFISAMRRLAAQNLAEEDPAPAVRWLFHTHPSITERVETARSYVPPSGRA